MAGIDYNRPAGQRENKETICDVHRDIYQLIRQYDNTDTDITHLKERVETAFKMGKSMDAKLRQYKGNYDDAWWELNKKAWDWDELTGGK
jgi:hypothetical protein